MRTASDEKEGCINTPSAGDGRRVKTILAVPRLHHRHGASANCNVRGEQIYFFLFFLFFVFLDFPPGSSPLFCFDGPRRGFDGCVCEKVEEASLLLFFLLLLLLLLLLFLLPIEAASGCVEVAIVGGWAPSARAVRGAEKLMPLVVVEDSTAPLPWPHRRKSPTRRYHRT